MNFYHKLGVLAAQRGALLHSSRSFARRIVAPRVVKVSRNEDSLTEKSSVQNINDDREDLIWQHEHRSTDAYLLKHSKREQPNDVPSYEKSEESHNDFRKLMLNLSVKKRRDKMNRIVLEGKRLINDAIQANVNIEKIFFTTDAFLNEIQDLDRITSEQSTKLVKVLYKDIKMFSGLSTSPGCMAVAQKPDYKQLFSQKPYQYEVSLSLVCDNIRDPGNMGTIIRTAAASGIKQVITTKGCCDIWNTKVLKASSGAHFRIPVYDNVEWHQMEEMFANKRHQFYFTDANPHPESTNYLDLQLFTMSRSQEKVLVVSNEAHGPSSECTGFLNKNLANSTRVHIPLGSQVESINSAIAASVLMFEFRKQFYLVGRNMRAL